ncbi:Hypothetical protein A7982_07374 [Minicystis rosea]|nr:Hypothetical protein A7982_07374 [Minicystis rosea]
MRRRRWRLGRRGVAESMGSARLRSRLLLRGCDGFAACLCSGTATCAIQWREQQR